MPEQLADPIVESRVHRERDKFIASISEEQVCELASSYRNGAPCRFFEKPARGSYNICFFVKFDDEEQWVVRVPLEPCLAFGGSRKLESEVATMQLVAEKTTIPIPKILAYSLSDSSEPLSCFLILEYIKGQKLPYPLTVEFSDEQRDRLYTSLADIFIQLRRLEFPSIGCLVRGPDGFQVGKKTVSIDINVQELEGIKPSDIQASYYKDNDRLTSANDYVAMLLDIADNAFMESHSRDFEDKEVGADHLYHLDMFRRYAEKWLDPSLDQGPFVLVHGDFEPYNLIVNEDMEIVSVLDWEWSHVVPRQFFKPPLWFRNPDCSLLAYNFVYKAYLERFAVFHAIVRTREREKYGNELLADEWMTGKVDSGFLVANALESWTEIDWFAFRYINWKWYKGKKDLKERVAAWMEEDPARKDLVETKFRKGKEYKAELERLEAQDTDPSSEGAHKDESSGAISTTEKAAPASTCTTIPEPV